MTIDLEEGESLTVKTVAGVVVVQPIFETSNYIVGVTPADSHEVEKHSGLAPLRGMMLMVRERESSRDDSLR